MNDERSREIIKQLYWIMDNFCSTYKVCKEFLISKEKKLISQIFPHCYLFVLLCTVDIYAVYYTHVYYYYTLTFIVATNKYYMHSAKTNNFFRECSTLGISVYTV